MNNDHHQDGRLNFLLFRFTVLKHYPEIDGYVT
jgi:hypothetical protein